MAHDHPHAHTAPTRLGRAFAFGIGLNLLFVLVEAAAGFRTGSLALLTDAGHHLELAHADIQHATLEVEFGVGACGEEREHGHD